MLAVGVGVGGRAGLFGRGAAVSLLGRSFEVADAYQDGLVAGVAGFIGAGDADGGHVGKRTFGFADAASDAFVGIDVGLFDDDLPAVAGGDLGVDGVDGLSGGGAMLLAHDAVAFVGVGDATRRIDGGESDPDPFFLLEGERLNGFGRAGQAAEVAFVLAESDFRYEHGGPHAFESRLEGGGLEPVGGADLHAQAAMDAALQEMVFFAGARGPYEAGIVGAGLRLGGEAERKQAGQSAGGRAEGGAASEVEPGDGPFAQGGLDGEPERLEIACADAVPAGKAFGGHPRVAVAGGGQPLAANRAASARVAVVVAAGEAEKEGAPGEEAEQRAGRTKVAAPEPGLHQVEQDDAREQGEQEAAAEERLPGGQKDVVAEEPVDGFGDLGRVDRADVGIGLVHVR